MKPDRSSTHRDIFRWEGFEGVKPTPEAFVETAQPQTFSQALRRGLIALLAMSASLRQRRP